MKKEKKDVPRDIDLEAIFQYEDCYIYQSLSSISYINTEFNPLITELQNLKLT